MIENSQNSPNITLKVSAKDKRRSLCDVLNDIISFSEEKRKLKNNSDKNKQSWSRIAISAISVFGDLLKSSELDDLESRLQKLEENQFQRCNR